MLLNGQDFTGKKEFIVGNAIQTFYTKVLGGISKEDLEGVYQKVVDENNPTEAVTLNENFVKAIRVISESSEEKNLSLFVLSLNTPELMQKWYAKFLPVIHDQLKAYGIILTLVDTMGNQIVFNEQNRVNCIIEHVEGKKNEYIPQDSPMLADDRETADRASEGVNVVNIEGEQFDVELVRRTTECDRYSKVIKNIHPSIEEFAVIQILLQEFRVSLRKEKIWRELKNTPLDKRQKLNYDDIRGFDLNDFVIQDQIKLNANKTRELSDMLSSLLGERRNL